MDLRQLRYFVGIVQAGSLSRAADQLHVAQSAISHHLASLESELGRQLVTRGPKGILLTEAGGVLYRHAEAILRHVEFAKQDALNVLECAVRTRVDRISGRAGIHPGDRTVRADPHGLSADPAASSPTATARCCASGWTMAVSTWPCCSPGKPSAALRSNRWCSRRLFYVTADQDRSPVCIADAARQSAAVARSRQRRPARRPAGVRETRAAARADRRMQFVEYDARAGRIRHRQRDHDMVRAAQRRSAMALNYRRFVDAKMVRPVSLCFSEVGLAQSGHRGGGADVEIAGPRTGRKRRLAGCHA